VAKYPGDFTLFLNRQAGERRPFLIWLWFINAAITTGVFTYSSFVGAGAIWLACIPGAALFIVAAMTERARIGRIAAVAAMVLLLLSLAYGYGVVRELNIPLDHSTAVAYRSTVVKKYKGRGWSRGLFVQPWGMVKEVENIPVPTTVWDSVMVGGPVCMMERAGALGVRWHTAELCP
jgi:hypothetical protein